MKNRFITYGLEVRQDVDYDDGFMADILQQELTGNRDPRNQIGLNSGINPADVLELSYHRDQLIEWEPQNAKE